MPKVYGYIRVSSIGQAMQGQSLEVQEEIIRKFFDYKLAKECEFVSIIKDPAVSASTKLRTREGGEHLDRQLEKGDHVVFSKLDRGFRNTIDLLETVRDWQARGITVHMLDIGIDLSSEMGQLLMGILGLFAEWERKRFIQRSMEGKARKKAMGKTPHQRYIGGHPPWAMKHINVGKKKVLIPCKYTREMARWFIECFERGWDIKKIWFYTLRNRIHRFARNGSKAEWSPHTIQIAMDNELALQKAEAEKNGKKHVAALPPGDASAVSNIQPKSEGDPSATPIAAEPDPPPGG
jgi:DNA invertase Pin-like site-specific DNA recombinase